MKLQKISNQNARLNLEIISFTTGFGQEVSIHAYNLKVGVHKSEKLAAAEYSLEFIRIWLCPKKRGPIQQISEVLCVFLCHNWVFDENSQSSLIENSNDSNFIQDG